MTVATRLRGKSVSALRAGADAEPTRSVPNVAGDLVASIVMNRRDP